MKVMSPSPPRDMEGRQSLRSVVPPSQRRAVLLFPLNARGRGKLEDVVVVDPRYVAIRNMGRAVLLVHASAQEEVLEWTGAVEPYRHARALVHAYREDFVLVGPRRVAIRDVDRAVVLVHASVEDDVHGRTRVVRPDIHTRRRHTRDRARFGRMRMLVFCCCILMRMLFMLACIIFVPLVGRVPCGRARMLPRHSPVSDRTRT